MSEIYDEDFKGKRCLAINEIKKEKGFENLSDQEAIELSKQLSQLAEIILMMEYNNERPKIL